MKIIYVVTDFKSGSNIMKGKQVVDVLKQNGIDCDIFTNIPLNITNSIIVFVGGLSQGHKLSPDVINKLKSNNNKIILDPADNLCYINSYLDEESLLILMMDGIIFPNKFSENHFMQDLTCKSITIPHHYDIKLNHIEVIKDPSFKICYAGSYYNDIYFETKPDWLYTNFKGHTDSVLDDLIKSPIHFSHREQNKIDFYFKPGTKLATAAATNSILLTSKDKSVIDILGEDYPFYIDEDINKTVLLINSLKNNYQNYNNILSEIKDKVNIEKIYLDYINFFNTFNI